MGLASHESAGQSEAEYGRSLQGRVHGSARDWADELAAAGFEAEAVIELVCPLAVVPAGQLEGCTPPGRRLPRSRLDQSLAHPLPAVFRSHH